MADLHTPFDAFERASEAVADGNRKVFAEIGVHFARYLHETDASLAADSPAFERFLDGFTPGEPPDGRATCARRSRSYQRQHSSPTRAAPQWIVLANLEIGLHEQTRLQPQIREAIDAAIPRRQGWRCSAASCSASSAS